MIHGEILWMTRPDQPCLWHGEVPPFRE